MKGQAAYDLSYDMQDVDGSNRRRSKPRKPRDGSTGGSERFFSFSTDTSVVLSSLIENRVSAEESTRMMSEDDPSCCWTFWIWINDSFLIRLLSAILTLQAAIMWIAFALNFILTLLFAPFNDRGAGSFISSWLIVPGITFL